jgi:hypothetical protein
VTDRTRTRVNAAFDDELSAAPVPPGLRVLSIRDAVTAPRRRAVQPQLLIVVATIVVIAVVATLVIGSHVLRSSVPLPAKQSGSPAPPAARSAADIVYDSAHHELVLFGGSTIEGRFTNETWTWDGKYWTLHRTSPSVLAPRDQAVMAYDQVHRVTVMYGGMELEVPGGKGGVGPANDTWTWDGKLWKQQHPAHEPGLSFDWPATMDFNSSSRTVLLYGFQKLPSGNGTTMQAETWSWNGSDWTRLSPSTSPTTIGQMVGGYMIAQSADRVGGRYVSQMWLWSGSNWVLLGPSNDAPFVTGSAAYDAKRGQLVVFNGDTWTWDGHGWTRQHPAHEPSAVGYLAYFPPLQMFVQYSAVYGNTSNDVWAWNGTDWTLLEAGRVAPPTPSGQLGPTTPDAAKAFIRQTMTATRPALFPAWLPSGMEAKVVATTDQFNLDLASGQRDKTIFLGTVAANPPPGGPDSSGIYVKFRNALGMKYQGAGTAEYFVYDASAPLSDRWLMWLEPGTTSVQGSTSAGVWYFLAASGLTDQEFWQVANSLG